MKTRRRSSRFNEKTSGVISRIEPRSEIIIPSDSRSLTQAVPVFDLDTPLQGVHRHKELHSQGGIINGQGGIQSWIVSTAPMDSTKGGSKYFRLDKYSDNLNYAVVSLRLRSGNGQSSTGISYRLNSQTPNVSYNQLLEGVPIPDSPVVLGVDPNPGWTEWKIGSTYYYPYRVFFEYSIQYTARTSFSSRLKVSVYVNDSLYSAYFISPISTIASGREVYTKVTQELPTSFTPTTIHALRLRLEFDEV